MQVNKETCSMLVKHIQQLWYLMVSVDFNPTRSVVRQFQLPHCGRPFIQFNVKHIVILLTEGTNNDTACTCAFVGISPRKSNISDVTMDAL